METRAGPSYTLLERSVLLLKIEEVRRGSDVFAGPPVFLVVCREYHQPVGLRIRQWIDDPSIDAAEDGRVSADAKREGENGDDCESWRFAQHTHAVANVHKKVFDGGPTPDGAAVFFNQSHIPKLAPSSVGGFFPGHPTGHQFLNLLFQVFPNLFRQLTIDTSSRK